MSRGLAVLNTIFWKHLTIVNKYGAIRHRMIPHIHATAVFLCWLTTLPFSVFRLDSTDEPRALSIDSIQVRFSFDKTAVAHTMAANMVTTPNLVPLIMIFNHLSDLLFGFLFFISKTSHGLFLKSNKIINQLKWIIYNYSRCLFFLSLVILNIDSQKKRVRRKPISNIFDSW